MVDSVLGSIYGVFVGDALGTTYEFMKAKDIKLPQRLNITGGGPFDMKKGQVTDDSEMTIALFRSIMKNKGYNKEDVAKAYIRWIKSDPKDSGVTTRRALLNAKTYKETISNAKKFNKNSLSNGFLMRIAPLAQVGMNLMNLNRKDLDDVIKEEVSITHPNKACFYTARLYVKILIYIIMGGKNIEKEALKIIKGNIILENIVKRSKKSPYFINQYTKNPYEIDSQYMGFMYVSLQIAFYELYNAKTYESAMRDIIKYGGDTDTNCAIAGALLGAKFGYDGIPKRWLKSIREAKYDRPEEFKVKDLIPKK